MIGSNDLKFRQNDEIINNIEKIIKNINANKIYVQSLFPLDKRRKWFNKRILLLNKELELFCQENNIKFIKNLLIYFLILLIPMAEIDLILLVMALT